VLSGTRVVVYVIVSFFWPCPRFVDTGYAAF
jgi:hypothetical protein